VTSENRSTSSYFDTDYANSKTKKRKEKKRTEKKNKEKTVCFDFAWKELVSSSTGTKFVKILTVITWKPCNLFTTLKSDGHKKM
jgi:hypothetical protein